MLCTNCGKNIPFAGNVCPYCHADKSEDKKKHARTLNYVGAVVIGGMAGVLVGFMISGPAICVGAILGPVLCVTLIFVIQQKNPNS